MRKNILIINIVAVALALTSAIYGIDLAIKGNSLVGIIVITISNFTIALICIFDWFMAKKRQI